MSAVTQSYAVERYYTKTRTKQYVGNRYMNNNPLSTFIIYAYNINGNFLKANFCLIFNTSQSFNTVKFTLTNFPICTKGITSGGHGEIDIRGDVVYGQTVSFTIQKNGLEWHDSSDDGWNESTIEWGTCIDGSPYLANPRTQQTPQNISISTNPYNLSIGKILYLGLLKLNKDNTNFNLQTVLS